jgi:apolipoprotein N-acyltransferase
VNWSSLRQLTRSGSFGASLFVALLAGAFNVFAFAPFHLWPLQIVSLALIFLLVIRRSEDWSSRQIAFLGLSYGFGWLFFGVSWLLIALTRYGGLPIWLSFIALALLAAFLACYSALALAAGHQLLKRWKLSDAHVLLLVLPALWALSEWLRGWLLTGFPWLVSGYAHTGSPFSGYASLIGVYGIGWVSALAAGAVALAIIKRSMLVRMLVLLIALVVVGLALRQVQWTQAIGKPLTVRLLQGNVDQNMKFDMDHINESLTLYRDMILAETADLIATPETALPLLSSQLPPDYLASLKQFSQTNQSHLIVGLAVNDGENLYSNSVVGFSGGDKQEDYRYDKHHLVPFGEFIPYGFHWFVQMMKIPLGDFSSAGLMQVPMRVKDQFVLPNICYEDLFGEEIAAQLAWQAGSKTGAATILMNASNLAWYGDSIAIPQHLQISQMRVLETGRPMLRTTNTGATAIISGSGEIIAQLKPLSRGTLSASVQGMGGLTPYIVMGNKGVILLALLALILAYILARKNRQG